MYEDNSDDKGSVQEETHYRKNSSIIEQPFEENQNTGHECHRDLPAITQK